MRKEVTVKEYTEIVNKTKQAVCKQIRKAMLTGVVNVKTLPFVTKIKRIGACWLLKISIKESLQINAKKLAKKRKACAKKLANAKKIAV